MRERHDHGRLTARHRALRRRVHATPTPPATSVVGAALDEIGWGSGRLYDEQVVAACQRVVRRGLVDLTETSV